MAFNTCDLGKTYLALGSETGARAFTASDVNVVTGGYSIIADRLFMNSTGLTDEINLYNQNGATDQFSLDVNDSIAIKYLTSEATGFTNAAKVKFGNIEAGFEASLGGLIFAKTDGASRQYGTQSFANGQQLDISVTITKKAGDNAEISITCVGNEGSDTISISGAMGTDRKIVFVKEANISYISVVQAYIVGNNLESNCVGQPRSGERLPLVGYSGTIEMQWKINELSNGKISIFDKGVDHDKYTTDYSYIREDTEADELLAIVQSTSRGVPVNIDTLNGVAEPNFYPFGPHVSNSNIAVNVLNFETVENLNEFGKIHRFNVSISPSDVIAFDTTETPKYSGAGFTFGTVLDAELPTMTPQEPYNVSSVRFGSKTYQNHMTSSSQMKKCILKWTALRENVKNILLFILTNRQLPFTLNAGDNYWPFGKEAGQGDFTVKISSPILKWKCISPDTWELETEVVVC